MTRLILIRHGQIDKNLDGNYPGDNDQSHLNDEGRSQMQKTALRLQELGLDILYSSKFNRAKESAEIISKQCNIPYEVINGIEDKLWGNASGQGLTNKLKKYIYKPANGESWKDVELRAVKAINEIVDKNKDKVIGILTHDAVIRSLLSYLLDTPREEIIQVEPKNGSLTIFDYIDKVFKKITVNDVSHL